MAKVKTPAPKKNSPSNGRKKNQLTNGKGDLHKNNGNGNDQDHKQAGRKPINDDGKEIVQVNWLEHWTIDKETKKPITREFPRGCTQEKFKELIKNYLNSWLDLWNVYQTKEEPRTLLEDQMEFEFTARTFTLKAYVDPVAEEHKHLPVKNPNGRKLGKKGGGHLTPPEPPPPPPSGGDDR